MEMDATSTLASSKTRRESGGSRPFRCETCGMQTVHVKTFLGIKKTTPITNEYVLNGRCLLCHPLTTPSINVEVSSSASESTTTVSNNSRDSVTRGHNKRTIPSSIIANRDAPSATDKENNSTNSSDQYPRISPSTGRINDRTSAEENEDVNDKLRVRPQGRMGATSRGDIKDLIRHMKADEQSPKVQEECCHELWKVSSKETKNNTSIREGGGIPAIVSAMTAHSDKAQLLTKACYCLWSVCMNNIKNQNAARHAGAIPAIADAMRLLPDNATLQSASCLALSTLACSNSENQVAIRHSKIIPLIVMAMMQHMQDVNVQKFACDCLTNLMKGNSSNVTYVRAAGATSTIFDTMEHHRGDVKVQEKAMDALRFLEREAMKMLKQRSDIKGIVAVMKSHLPSSKFQEECCEVLCSLASPATAASNNIDKSKSKAAKNRKIIRQVGGLEAILAAMKHHVNVAFVQRSALSALLQLCRGSLQNQKEICQQSSTGGGIIAVAAAMEQHDRDPELQCAACNVLTLLFASSNRTRNQEADTIATSVGLLIPLVVKAMANHRDSPTVQKSACNFLAALASGNKSTKVLEFVRRSGCIDELTATMDCYIRSDITVMDRAYRAIASFDVEEALVLVTRGDVRGIVFLMKNRMDSTKIQEEACNALCKLSSSSNSTSSKTSKLDGTGGGFIRESGGITAIVNAMNHHAAEQSLQLSALAALISLSSNHTTNQTAICSAGGISAIKSAMKQHIEDAQIQASTCCALANISANNATNQDVLRNENAIPLVVLAMKRHMAEARVQQFGAGALASLGAKNPKNMSIIRSEGGNDMLTSALKRHANDKCVVDPAMGAQSNLEKDALRIIGKSKGRADIPVIVNLMRTHLHDSPIVQAKACNVLWTLSSKCDKNDNLIRSAGGIVSIVTAMKKHAGEKSVIEESLGALWNLTSNNVKNQDTIREAGGVHAICDAMDRHEDDANIQASSSCTLANLASNNSANQRAIQSAGGIQLVISAMRRYTQFIDVQHFGCGAIANLSWNNEENTKFVVKEGGVVAILAAMDEHSDQVDIQCSACGALTNICETAGFLDRVKEQHVHRSLNLAATKFPAECGEYAEEVRRRLAQSKQA